jgi:hypothetical protein
MIIEFGWLAFLFIFFVIIIWVVLGTKFANKVGKFVINIFKPLRDEKEEEEEWTHKQNQEDK